MNISQHTLNLPLTSQLFLADRFLVPLVLRQSPHWLQCGLQREHHYSFTVLLHCWLLDMMSNASNLKTTIIIEHLLPTIQVEFLCFTTICNISLSPIFTCKNRTWVLDSTTALPCHCYCATHDQSTILASHPTASVVPSYNWYYDFAWVTKTVSTHRLPRLDKTKIHT